MRKIPSLFMRNYETDRLVRDEVVPGSEWVLAGEGHATIKHDGTAVMVRGGKLYKRYDRKRHKKTGEFKDAPPGWEPCEEAPNKHTGHWPGWVPVGDEPGSKWHREAFAKALAARAGTLPDGTYEAVGPHFQRNPYGLVRDILWRHGMTIRPDPPRDFSSLRDYLSGHPGIEGIVWHHPDGRMVKIKRRDFGLPWPPETP